MTQAVPHEYDMEVPKREKAYLVPEHIFNKIKNRLSKKKSVGPVCQNIGSLSLGIAGSAFITALTVENSYCWFIFGLSLIAGSLFWIFSYIFEKIENTNNVELLTDLSILLEHK